MYVGFLPKVEQDHSFSGGPLLDVHAPHQSTHTWTDFFIHIGTIAVGLLLAIGLEQVVELAHQHEQLKQANEALQREVRYNVIQSQMETVEVRREHDDFTGDLAALQYLKSHPHTPLNQLPAPLSFGALRYSPSTAAWDALRSSPVAALKSVGEMERTTQRYNQINRLNDQESRVWDAAVRASEYSFPHPDPRNLTPAELDLGIAAVEDLLAEHFKEAVYLENVCDGNTDIGFKPCITKSELDEWGHMLPWQKLIVIYGAAGQAHKERHDKSRAEIDALRAQQKALDAKP